MGTGSFALSSKVQAFYSGTSPFVNCSLVGPSGTLDTAYWYDAGISGYGEVVNQAVFTTTSPTNVQLNCNGSNAGVFNKKLQGGSASRRPATTSLPTSRRPPVPQHLR